MCVYVWVGGWLMKGALRLSPSVHKRLISKLNSGKMERSTC